MAVFASLADGPGSLLWRDLRMGCGAGFELVGSFSLDRGLPFGRLLVLLAGIASEAMAATA